MTEQEKDDYKRVLHLSGEYMLIVTGLYEEGCRCKEASFFVNEDTLIECRGCGRSMLHQEVSYG